MSDDESLRYPIGRPDLTALTPESRAEHLSTLAGTPAAYRAAVEDLNDEQLDTAYREGGWTVRQVVHHVADSHLNGYLRCKWVMTEREPALKGYDQPLWAELPEARTAPVSLSLELLTALHGRWVASLPDPDDEAIWARPAIFPGDRPMDLERILGLYAWHGEHHLAHIRGLRDRRGW